MCSYTEGFHKDISKERRISTTLCVLGICFYILRSRSIASRKSLYVSLKDKYFDNMEQIVDKSWEHLESIFTLRHIFEKKSLKYQSQTLCFQFEYSNAGCQSFLRKKGEGRGPIFVPEVCL